ncbi:amino acid adenylation domain-containing protein [Tumebacillus sp. BK434]|uniref:non-ribosomal peptide synthetase n=1 Tax=Tumebacillus sp. BK434 TaxID=2512169 RepID=UPI001043B24A|nr:non-ribosomal peptide synthetase [Tumebacillus sp. BK434]TCP59315.1 amino acid adenylation domain-containing protein [Tumebacillus sp. BK434]
MSNHYQEDSAHLEPAQREEVYVFPASFAQQRMWVLDQLMPGSSAYNIPFAVRMQGQIDAEVVAACVGEIVARHEVLRTRFLPVEGQPMQVIASTLDVPVLRADLRSMPAAEREAALLRHVETEAAQPFDLRKGPLLRVHLICAGEEEHVLLLTLHHIIADGWSMGVFVHEFVALYEAFRAGLPSPLPELEIQYADYAEWQREWLQGDVLEQQLAFWRGQLGDDPPALQLPTDFPRPPVQTHHGATATFTLPDGLAERLKKVGQEQGVTMFMLLVTAFQILMHRYSGQDDIAVGTPVAGRNSAETEELIGLFVNTIVLRADLAGNPRFCDLLQRVRETAVDAFAHADVPFEKLVEELKPERDMSISPLFQVMFTLQTTTPTGIELPGVTISPVEFESRLAKFDMELAMQERPEGLTGWLEYNTDLFAPETIAQMIGHFTRLLEGIAEDPARTIGTLPLLTDAERRTLLHDWNDTEADFPQDICLHHLFERQAEQTPELVAAIYGEQTLTYSELEAQANQLAHHLQALGVGPDVPVGVCVERSLDLVIALLGVLKAGGAFVPVDPEAPQDRIDQLLEESQAAVCLAQSHLKAGLPTERTAFVFLDEQRAEIAGQPTARPQSQVQPHHLVSIYYTSGSTGKPKGVANEHLGWVNRMVWNQKEHRLQAGETVLQKTTLTFDDSAVEVFWPLMVGGRIALLEPGLHRDPQAMVAAAIGYEAVLIQFVPSVLRLFLEAITAETQGKLSKLRSVISSGEALRPELVGQFFERLPGRRLYNLCGATEVSIDSTVHLCSAADLQGEIVSIGKPFDNNTVYILDAHLQPVPIGAVGEIFYGGVGLARGYWNRPDLTEKAFLPSPFAPGARIYKTGDRAYFRRDGSVQFLGRNDDQVKVRGVRVELGEIEVALASHRSVRNTVVLAHEFVKGDKRLIAYVLPHAGQTAEPAEYRRFLKEKLPDYMVPSLFLTVDEIPLTPNGKVDRRALPLPSADQLGRVGEYRAPRSGVEQKLSELYSEVLGVPQVGILDNFFELGGHSLLATQVVSRIRDVFAIEFQLRHLFEAPQIADLALRIESALFEQKDDQLPPITPAARDEHLPLSFAQQRLWVIDQMMPGSSLYNIVFGLRLTGALHRPALERSLNEIIRRHEILRTSFQQAEDGPRQVIAPHEPNTLTVIDLTAQDREAREEDALRFARDEAKRGFDLTAGPLLRCFLLQLDAKEHVLVLNLHHIISDGWSTGVLVKEFAALYAASVQDAPSPLPELAVQYADYALWQRTWLEGERIDEQLRFWKDKLHGLEPLQLPTDHPRPAVLGTSGGSVPVVIPQHVAAELTKIGQSVGATLYSTLLAAFQTLLYRYSGQEDFAVGTPVAGRTLSEIEPLIGFFVNTLVLRSGLSADLTFQELAARAQAAALEAFAHQDVPFEKLVEELQPERSMNHSPLFQVMFALQNTPQSSLELPELSVEPLEIEHGNAMFDLSLTLTETADGLRGELEYNRELFTTATAERMAGHFAALLGEIAAAPDEPLSSYRLLTDREAERLLVDWNGGELKVPGELLVHHLFERQAELQPDAVAVHWNGRTWSYCELNEQANRLARRLRQCGAGPETLVGICVQRSQLMVVTALAVLKAGAAYVPIDPGYPQERIALMLEQCELAVLLTEADVLAKFPPLKAEVLLVEQELLSAEESGNLEDLATPGNLAYVIFTSGTTGVPKGVMVQHDTLLYAAHCYLHEYRYEHFRPRMLQVASMSFDVFAGDLLRLSISGGSLVICPEDVRMDLPALYELICQSDVQCLDLTPGLAMPLMEYVYQNRLPFDRVKVLTVGSDAFAAADYSLLLERFGSQMRILNAYGITETTIDSGSYETTREQFDLPLSGHVPIGKPLPGTKFYILDANMQPQPIGVAGELYIGGQGVARGYYKRPDLTAASFVDNPLCPGERLYKTGDLGAWLADGTVNFLGRRDDQVKLRGFRIELREIEAVLARHPQVADAAVILREDQPGDRRLAAYYTASGTLDVEILRRHAKSQLPAYMVPSAFVQLEAMPLTPNLKLDRRALPVPDYSQTAGYAEPATEGERIVAELFAEVLGAASVGAEDDFFAIGGHSLLAAQVMGRLNARLQTEIPLRALFEHPTPRELAAALERGQVAADLDQLPPMEPVDRGGVLPLSFAQQRLWMIDQMLEEAAVYSVPLAVRLTGRLDAAALEQSFNGLLHRHEILRTRFAEVSGQPVQVIDPELQVPFERADLSDMPAQDRETALLHLISEEVRRTFDLGRGPLLRTLLVRLADDEHALLLNMHHIITDGWSMELMIRELSARYADLATGNPFEIPAQGMQYADYAVWQRNWLTDEVMERQLRYWRTQLGGELPVLQLLTDRPRPAVQTYRGAREEFQLPNGMSAALQALSRQHGTTLFLTLLAAFQTLLYRSTGQEDFTVGTPIAGRRTQETEQMIGFFVNMLVLRSDTAGADSFAALLSRVRETALAAYAHQDVPFERLVEELHNERDLSRSPLFQAVFALQNQSNLQLELPELTLSMVDLQQEVARFDLNLTLTEAGEELYGALEYNTDLFDAATIKRMIGHFEHLLQSILAEPHLQLSRLPMIGQAERRDLLYRFNDTAADYPTAPLVHELFEAQAALVPERTAVVYETQRLSYHELNERANQLAHHLRELGVGPDKIVGICLERSPEMIIALLAVLKAGGAYVAFDPTYPQDRVAYMLELTDVPVVLTERSLLPLLAGAAQVFCFDRDWAQLASHSRENPHSGARPEHLAYVIFTSGSTGRPKGVMVEHRNLLNYLYGIGEVMQLPADASYGNVSTLAADVGNTAIYPALCRGGTLHLLSQERIADPGLMADYFAEHPVDLLKIVPTHLAALMTAAPEKVLPRKGMVLGGETLRWDLIKRIEEHGPGRFVINHYGPTEVTIAGVVYRVEADPETRTTPTVPLGHPIGNVQVYLLDAHLEPVPIGVPGEVYFGGAGVTRGYLGRPDLTAERYLPDPFSERPGARLYKTGDLARRLPDGRMEFLTRIDSQVKIRGYRVELGEVETALGHHQQVQENVVTVHEDETGDRRLIAYVVLEEGAVLDQQELRDFMGRELPDYMVPSVFVSLPAIPLTPNGKIDRRALPLPDLNLRAVDEAYLAPRTPHETQVARIFAEVLRVERVGVEDDFFALGGHSLMATQAISRISATFAVKVPLRLLFACPTVAALAEQVATLQATALAPQEMPIPRASRSGELPLSFAQERMWVLDRLIPQRTAYNMAYAVRMAGTLNVPALEQSINGLLARHESFRTVFRDGENGPVQLIVPHAWSELHSIDLRSLPAEQREAVLNQQVQAEADTAFDLSAGPLVRFRLWQTAEQEHVLLLTLHHIISDGWSRGIFTQELADRYGRIVQGGTADLPELPLQYADFAVWQREWMQGEELQKQLTYWKKQLGGELPMLQLPTDHPRPAIQTYNGATARFALSSAQTQSLQRLSREQGTTLFMTLLSAFQTLLARLSGQDDIIVGTPIAGRTRKDTEGIVGLFLNTLALRADLTDDPAFAELLQQVREMTLGAFAHQDLPFEKLVEELDIERDLSRSPLFQVFFALQNMPTVTEFVLSDLTMSAVECEHNTSKFDLSLYMTEAGETLTGVFEYNTDLFAAATIERMIGHFLILLEGVVQDPAQRVSALPLLSEAERSLLLRDWNATGRELASQIPVHRLFERQAAETPQEIAAVCGEESLTYRQLNEQANLLAHHLLASGAGRDKLIGLCLDRSLDMLVGLFGILKAGSAYVPLDPTYPQERLQQMLEDSQAQLLVTSSVLQGVLPAHRARVIELDGTEWQASGRTDNPDVAVDERDLAYVIYTSGSTGQPKGVAIEHRSLSNFLLAMREETGFGGADTLCAVTSLSFDIAGLELYLPLISGARVVVADRETAGDGDRLARLLAAHHTTYLQATPVTWQMLLAAGWNNPEGLSMLVGGEALPAELADRLLRLEAPLYNLYGPTEATIWATVQRVQQADRAIPIGRPIANTCAYVLDAHLQPVPAGVAGELYLGGHGIARGYFNRPELSAERFLPNPHCAGDILYKTGDSVRWLADGTLDYLERLDNQVKIRGFRIELGDIEAALLQHPQIRQAVVTARADRTGSQLLAAYLIAPELTDVEEVSRLLQNRLPAYMLPAAYQILEQFPLTPNGKIDRKALPEPDFASGGSDAFVAPRTQLEQQVAAIWSEVLGVEQVGVTDHFFRLGGHSLKAAQVISRLRSELHKDVPLRTLFEAPTVAGLAAALAQIGATSGGAPIPAVGRDGELPLSYAQQRLWLLEQMLPAGALYNMPYAVRLSGPLDRAALAQSIGLLTLRHETLRTTFAERAGSAVQVIAPALEQALDYRDLRDLPSAEREQAAVQMAQTAAETPFDLQTGPLVRFLLLQTADAEHLFVMVMHHIISDGWSMHLLAEELSLLYSRHLQGDETLLPALAVQYADYAAWQRSWLQGEELHRQLSYWSDKLSGELPVLQLPTDRPHPPVQTHRGAVETFELSEALTAQLQALSTAHDATLFMTLLTAFQTLLLRYSGQDDIAVGTPVAGRQRKETEPVIGFFINTLVLRTDLSGSSSFADALSRVRETALGAFAHQDLPFEQLVERVVTERDPSRTPLFQVMFALQNLPGQPLELPGLSVEELALARHTAKFELSLAMEEADGRLNGAFEYNTDLFDAATIRRLIGHFGNLLQHIVTAPQTPLGDLELLSAEERQTLLVEWNQTAGEYPEDRTAQQLFEEQVLRTPQALAVVHEETALTYEELNRQANRLAHHLRGKGAGRDTVIGLCTERSPQMIIGMLGILKAGAAYIPLDSTQPQERLQLMLDDAEPLLIVTEQHLLPLIADTAAEIVLLDGDAFRQEREDNPPLVNTPQDLFYILYTSGTTGKPKGVECIHTGPINLLADFQQQQAVRRGDNCSVWTSVGFDVSVLEIFTALVHGAAVRIVPEAVRTDSAGFFCWLAENEIHSAYVPPFVLKEFAAWLAAGNPSSLRRLIVGVEPIRERLLAELHALIPGVTIINGYGPTEASIASERYVFDPQHVSDRITPIGRPVQNTTVYLLDRHLHPVPVGVYGEVHIGGIGLARGYRKQPELQAERFIAHPFSAEPDARLYKTGDLARYLPDGNIEFLGRVDNQVKIRGFRIELGEVEAALTKHPSVAESICLVRTDEQGHKRLIAYFLAARPVTAVALRSHLQAVLPGPMVPSAFVEVEQWPLNPNGKIDRRALPEPAQRADAAAYLPPRDALEWELATLWQDVLGHARVGLQDDFFQLGGHSLLAVRLLSEAERRFGQRLPMSSLFYRPTVEGMAGLLRHEEPALRADRSPLVKLQEGTAGATPLCLVHAVSGNAFSYLDLAAALPGRPVYALQAAGLEPGSEPLTDIRAMAAQYVQALRAERPQGPYLLAGWSFGGAVAYEMAAQLIQSGQAVERVLLLDTRLPQAGAAGLSEPDESDLALGFVRDLAGRLAPQEATESFTGSELLTAEEILREALTAARARRALPETFELADMERLFRVYCANITALYHYAPAPSPVPLALLRAEAGSLPDTAAAEWQQLAGEIVLRCVPGDHYTLVQPPNTAQLAATITALLQDTTVAADK